MSVLTATSSKVKVSSRPKTQFIWLTKGTIANRRYIWRKNRPAEELPVELYF